jgi:hypothetical protein
MVVSFPTWLPKYSIQFFEKIRGVLSHYGLVAIYIKKYLKAKEENYGNSNIYFTMQKKKKNLQKKPSNRNQNPSRYHNSITNLKFQHKP